jgi:hypothetical protein
MPACELVRDADRRGGQYGPNQAREQAEARACGEHQLQDFAAINRWPGTL